jgi:hypothetical protein
MNNISISIEDISIGKEQTFENLIFFHENS